MKNLDLEGRDGILNYTIEKKDDSTNYTTYKITCEPWLLLLANTNHFEFIDFYVPSYGKYEVEEFIAKRLLASLISGDITELFNTSISYYDYPYGYGEYSKDTIKKSILQYCEVLNVDNDKNVITLKYLGKKLSNS